MSGNASTIGYMEGQKYIKDVNLKNESYIERLVREQWEKDKDQILTGYKNGSHHTQHGVNAEYFHAGIKNAEEIRLAQLEGRAPNLIEKAPFINGPDDLIQGDKVIQMKYHRTTGSSLDGCIDHLEKYKGTYANNENALYVIPSEQYQQLIDIKQGQIPEGMSGYQARTLKNKIERFEAEKGAPIETIMEPGAVTYEEAQLKNIELTAQETEEAHNKQHEEEVDKINESVKPSVLGALKAACYAAGAASVLTGAIHVYNDYCEGKNIFNNDYEKEDYKNLFTAMGESAVCAGGSSALFYAVSAMVKQKVLAASFITNMIKGVGSLKLSYLRGEITLKEFTELSVSLSICTLIDAVGEAGIAAIISTIFATISAAGVSLPAIVSFVAGMMLSIFGGIVYTKLVGVCKDFLFNDLAEIKAKHDAFMARVDNLFTENVNRLNAEFAVFATDVGTMDNVHNDYQSRAEASNRLSEQYGTNKIDPNESIESLKARFLRK